MFCSLWDLVFSRLYSAKQLQRPKPPCCCAIGQTSKPSSAQQIWNCSSQPTARQEGFGLCAPHVLLLPAAPAPLMDFRAQTHIPEGEGSPCNAWWGAEFVFGVGGPRMIPRQLLGKHPPSLCTGGLGVAQGFVSLT